MELCNLALVLDQSSCDDLAGLNKNLVTSFTCNSPLLRCGWQWQHKLQQSFVNLRGWFIQLQVKCGFSTPLPVFKDSDRGRDLAVFQGMSNLVYLTLLWGQRLNQYLPFKPEFIIIIKLYHSLKQPFFAKEVLLGISPSAFWFWGLFSSYVE